MQQKFNFITRFSNKVRTSSVVTLFSLAKEKSFVRVLNKFIPKLIRLSSSKLKISPRLRRFNKFVGLLFKINKHHGPAYAVKWLKANHMALQRSLGSLPMTTLRELEPQLPLTRLINGLPPFIGTMDRKAIRNNCYPTIRLWLSILSLYRVIEAPMNPKLSTITDPYKGTQEAIDKVLDTVNRTISSSPSKFICNLKAERVVKSLKASPNNKVAIQSLITDVIAIAKYPEIYELIKQYCIITKSYQFFKQMDSMINWSYDHLQKHGPHFVKRAKSLTSFDDVALGKLSFKEEAAGKLRIFAIADIWTQSLFKPLHDSLFSYLRGLPNDGTFDQEAAFKRCLDKSITYRSVYSVDLSSATDRLPIDLQVGILDKLTGLPIGSLWKRILVDRPYMIRKNDYVPSGYVYYSTGQPMGCLSSWAMLAVTHHAIMQYCSQRVYNTNEWCTDYEILGDDLVIFDTKLYHEYLSIMKELDVGINLSKSLVSDHLSAFEFAKRTGVDGVDVSGISLKQLIAENSLLGRVNQVIYFGLKGLIPSVPMLLQVLGNGDKSLSLPLNEEMKERLVAPLMALLGYFAHNERISLEAAVSFITDPQDEELGFLEKPKLPYVTTLQFITKLLNSNEQIPVPISDLEDREDLVKEEVIPYMADSMVRDSLSRIQQFTGQYDAILKEYSLSLVNVCPISLSNPAFRHEDDTLNILSPEIDGWATTEKYSAGFNKISEAQLLSFAQWALLKDRDPDDEADALYEYVYNLRSELPPLKVAEKWTQRIDNFISSFDFKPSSKAYQSAEIPSLLREIRASGKLSNIPFWKIVS